MAVYPRILTPLSALYPPLAVLGLLEKDKYGNTTLRKIFTLLSSEIQMTHND